MYNRRKFERFRIIRPAFFIHLRPGRIRWLRPEIVKIGPLLDISMGGLGFTYVEKAVPLEDYASFSVLMGKNEIQLHRFPFRTVSDIVIAELDSEACNISKIRRRCVQFSHLNHHQRYRLKGFLEENTQWVVRDRRRRSTRRYPYKKNDPFIFLHGWQNDKGRRKVPDRRMAAGSTERTSRFIDTRSYAGHFISSNGIRKE